jgi:hypothetical protein
MDRAAGAVAVCLALNLRIVPTKLLDVAGHCEGDRTAPSPRTRGVGNLNLEGLTAPTPSRTRMPRENSRDRIDHPVTILILV